MILITTLCYDNCYHLIIIHEPLSSPKNVFFVTPSSVSTSYFLENVHDMFCSVLRNEHLNTCCRFKFSSTLHIVLPWVTQYSVDEDYQEILKCSFQNVLNVNIISIVCHLQIWNCHYIIAAHKRLTISRRVI